MADCAIWNHEVIRAIEYALEAHGEQKRKYTNEPYIVHPLRVARKVNNALAEWAAGNEELTHAALAAILHDVVEDTPRTFEDITRAFGARVCSLVRQVTEVSVAGSGDRAVRKKIDNKHYATAGFEGKTIKLADSIDNLRDVVRHDPAFARVYLPEMRERLVALRGGHKGLHGELTRLVDAYFYLHGERA